MTSLQEAVWNLRKLCADNGIYTLSALDCFVHTGDGGSQGQVAADSHQSQSATSIWVNLAEARGLVEVTRKPNLRRKLVTYTEDGTALISQIKKLLCQNS